MTRDALHFFLILILVLVIGTGCAGIKLTPIEHEMLQELRDNLKQTETNISALRILDDEQQLQDELPSLVQELTQIQVLVPPALKHEQDPLPQRIKISKEQKVVLTQDVYPRSQKLVNVSEQVLEVLATSLLKQISSNLEIIWSIEDPEILPYRRSATFAIAHNAFVQAHRRYPAVDIDPIITYSDRPVEFNEQAGDLIPQIMDEAIPDVISTAQYIEKSNKITEKILFHYLTRRGGILIALAPSILLPSPFDSIGREMPYSLGTRILMALDKTFGSPTVDSMRQEERIRVYFPLGGYTIAHLSDTEKTKIAEITERFATVMNAYYSEQMATISITTIGHTDQTPLREESPFVQNFIRALEESGLMIPEEQPARREVLNKNFSRLRALLLSEHIKQLLRAKLGGDANVNIISEVVGKGEELPEGLNSPYTKEDRRMCLVTIRIQG